MFHWSPNLDGPDYRENELDQVPIQAKACYATCFELQKTWFKIEGLVLVRVWSLTVTPEFFIFESLSDVEDALGLAHCATSLTSEHLARMKSHKDRWDRIELRLKPANVCCFARNISWPTMVASGLVSRRPTRYER
jgi:hypothetical protein